MIRPCRSPVAPRIVSPETGEVIALVDEIEACLAGDVRMRIRIQGESNRHALRHLAAVLVDSVQSGALLLEDQVSDSDTRPIPQVEVTTRSHPRCDRVLQLSNWCRDDLIEYLLTVHPHECRTVMEQLKQFDLSLAGGSPTVWKTILDELAQGYFFKNPKLFICQWLRQKISNIKKFDKLLDEFIVKSIGSGITKGFVSGMSNSEFRQRVFQLDQQISADVLNCLAHSDILQALSVQRLAQRIQSDRSRRMQRLLGIPWPADWFPQLVEQLQGHPRILADLTQKFGKGDHPAAANIASLLVLFLDNWRPDCRNLYFIGGQFSGVDWSQQSFVNSTLHHSNFESANLRSNQFGLCQLFDCNFRHANLRLADFSLPSSCPTVESADVSHIYQCDFENANLEQSCLTGRSVTRCKFSEANLQRAYARLTSFTLCDFSHADLRHATFVSCKISGLPFSPARMDRVCFQGCHLEQLNLEHHSTDSPSFEQTSMIGSDLTGSTIRRGNFESARLCGSRMAEINWEYCNLIDADLAGCEFHYGSSRSGLVGSPYPSHGTRTGFYTDDYSDQNYKAPEEIRKASFYGSDLRGANLNNVDLYLVDLRETRLGSQQRAHARACGAILD